MINKKNTRIAKNRTMREDTTIIRTSKGLTNKLTGKELCKKTCITSHASKTSPRVKKPLVNRLNRTRVRVSCRQVSSIEETGNLMEELIKNPRGKKK